MKSDESVLNNYSVFYFPIWVRKKRCRLPSGSHAAGITRRKFIWSTNVLFVRFLCKYVSATDNYDSNRNTSRCLGWDMFFDFLIAPIDKRVNDCNISQPAINETVSRTGLPWDRDGTSATASVVQQRKCTYSWRNTRGVYERIIALMNRLFFTAISLIDSG